MAITTWARPVEAVLFDLDGTLMHTAPDIATAINQMLVGRNLPALNEETITRLIGRGSPVLVERVFETLGKSISPGERLQALQAFQDCYEHVVGRRARPYPGVVEALEQLRDMGLKLGIVTNKYHRFAIRLLQKFQISSLFDLVVGGDTLEVRKPNPTPILHAIDCLGVATGRTIYIGDSPIDVEAATAAGVPVFCVPYGYREGKPLSALDCNGYIDSLQDVPALITGRFDTGGIQLRKTA